MGSSLPHTGATRASLLSRVRNAEDHAAWREFEDRYRELLLRFCRKRGLQHADAEDVVQTVFVNLTKTLPQFTYDPQRGRFRNYLYRCTRNVLARWSRRPIDRAGVLDMDEDCADPAEDGAAAADSAIWQEEWVAHHYRLALVTVRAQFDNRNIELFERSLNGESVAALASAYGISEDAVYRARQRIRERLQELIAMQVRAEDGVDDEP